MGQTGSAVRGLLKRLVMRYNAEYRAHSFLEKNKLPKAPRHPTVQKLEARPVPPEVKNELAKLHEKDKQLEEYLSKVYLTSETKIVGDLVVAKRPLPQKREVDLHYMFYEPEQAAAGHCTLSNIVKMMVKFNEDPKKWTPSALAQEYNLDRETVVKLLTYYSLFRREDLEFMNVEPEEKDSDKIEFEVFNQLEKKPLKQIEGKK